MAKHISKSVIEDIAYELKRVGLSVIGFKTGTLPEGEVGELDLNNPEDVLDWVIDNTENVLAEHDPTFDNRKFREQVEYKI